MIKNWLSAALLLSAQSSIAADNDFDNQYDALEASMRGSQNTLHLLDVAFDSNRDFPDSIRFIGNFRLTEIQQRAVSFLNNYINNRMVDGSTRANPSWNDLAETAIYYQNLLVDNDKCDKGEFLIAIANAMRHAEIKRQNVIIGYGQFINGWYHNLKLLNYSSYIQSFLEVINLGPNEVQSFEERMRRSVRSTQNHLRTYYEDAE